MRSRSFVGRAVGPLLLFAAAWLHAQTSTKEQFEDLSRRAQAALDSHPEDAIQLYKQALAIRPDWPEGWLYMGGALYQKGSYAEATDALRKGIGLAPVFADGWAILGRPGDRTQVIRCRRLPFADRSSARRRHDASAGSASVNGRRPSTVSVRASAC